MPLTQRKTDMNSISLGIHLSWAYGDLSLLGVTRMPF